jgi:competence protein ComEA
MRMVRKMVTVLIVVLAVAALVQVAAAGEPVKIDLNKASAEELMQIKGIGKTYAQRIVEYRENNGQFTQIEDIMKVRGIGEKLFESVKDIIVVDTE